MFRRLGAVIALLIGLATPLAAGAQDDAAVDDGVRLQLAALSAVDVSLWELQEDDIAPRRAPLAAYEEFTAGIAAETAAARVEAEEELAAAEDVLGDAVDHRADMEEEVEGYSIEMWVLGDLGLQELYDSEAERARQAQPVIAVTNAMIERVEDADAAIVDAQAEVDAAALVLAEREAADDRAQQVLRGAVQITERFEALVIARQVEIDRWTGDVLSEERPNVTLATITSVTVQVPIGVSAATTDNEADGDSASEPVPTQATTVEISPIVVNAEIAGQVQALIGAARSDGINLHGGGYRDRENQIALRIAHCGTSGYDIFEKPSGECSPPTARPGASQHEVGLAVDFTENGSILTWGSPGFNWMVENAASYGLINLPSEAWHWSTTGH